MDEADRILNMDFEQEVMIYVLNKCFLGYFVDEGHFAGLSWAVGARSDVIRL